MASTSTIQLHPDPKCRVFLSFHGKDTRLTFTSYLYHALLGEGIQTFIDSEDLESSREISSALIRVIEDSEIAVIIFSENYGSSSWCLDELLHIMRRKDDNGLVVIPIFYHIDPSTVRWQNGTFGDGFLKLREYHNDDNMDAWKKVLENAADISGSHRTQSYSSESEPILIKKIIEDILKKLDRTSFYNCDITKGLIGIDTRFEELKSLITISSQDVHLVGVWGMGGIGKTTLARILYDRLKSQFHVHCFLVNVRETLEKQGQNYLENKFYSQLFNENDPKFRRERLRHLKALIVLDDVDDISQMIYLMGIVKHGLVGSGSKIIVTTRNEEVLGKADHTYTFIPLDLDESYQLFLLHAFNGGKPSKEYEVVLDKVVRYAKGIPLALTILGSFLCDMRKQDWDRAWEKLEGYSNDKIDAVLRISYNGLDLFEKDIFLDIACFFVGEKKDSVQEILDACGLFANLGINVLRKRCLISIDEVDILHMHDLVCGMAHKIAIEENTEKHGKGKRIFKMDDVQNVLQDNTGVATIRGIILNNYQSKKLVLSSTCFSRMCGLIFLKIYDSLYHPHNVKLTQCNYKVDAPEGLTTLPSELIYLHWVGYKSNYIPTMFNPINLVELIMPYSLLKQLWNGVQLLVNLRKIDLSYSTKLIEISGISKAKNLKVVNLQGCESLRELPLSFKKVCMLTSLNINGCNKLWSGNINPLGPLRNFKYLTNLRELKMKNASIEIVPVSIECLSCLVELDLSNCSRLKSLPTSICTMKSLEKLCANFCERLENFPEILNRPSRLKSLELMDSGIKNLPTSIHRLTSLEKFNLYRCTKLEKFPEILEPMESLKELSLSGTGITKLCMSIGKLVGLDIFDLSECENLRFIPNCISRLNSLDVFSVFGCLNLEKLPSLPIGLRLLFARDCKALRSMSELPSNLQYLGAQNCLSLEAICSSITTNDPVILKKKAFAVDNCPKLEQGNLWAEARAETLRQAILSRNNIPKEKNYEPLSADVEMRWSGNEIPEWMTYRNNGGSSIAIDLPPNWCDPNFLGFALCVVLGGNDNCNNWVHCEEKEDEEEEEEKEEEEETEEEEEEEKEEEEEETEEEEKEEEEEETEEEEEEEKEEEDEFILCMAVFRSSSGESGELFSSCSLPCEEDKAIHNSDSVFFFYNVNLSLHPRDTSIVANRDCETCHVFNQVTFDFYESRKECALIKKCGVHMLYSHEAEKCGLMISGDTSKPTTSGKRCREDFEDKDDESEVEKKRKTTQTK